MVLSVSFSPSAVICTDHQSLTAMMNAMAIITDSEYDRMAMDCVRFAVRARFFVIFIANAILIGEEEEEEEKSDDDAESSFCVRMLMHIKMDIYIRQSSVPCIIYSHYTLYLTL